MNKIHVVLVSLFLSACSSTVQVTTKPVERVTLDVTVPPPLILREIQWRVFDIQGKPYFALDTNNFEKFV